MVLRIFIILLAVNTLAFVARADAAESDSRQVVEVRMMMEPGGFENIDADNDAVSELADLGARFLKWRFSDRDDTDGERYASERVFSDHGVAVVDDGAALNLTWRF